MKIQLELTAKHLSTIVFAFNQIPERTTEDRHVKVARSILDEPILKLEKKQLEVSKNLNLFNQKKRMKFTFKYHEAHYLEQFFALAYPFMISDYDKNVIRMIRDKLNQQLA